MKNLCVKSLALCCVFAFAGCEKNRDADDPMTKGETTTPHSMEAAPVSPNTEIHDDMQHTSAPALIEEQASGVQTGNATSHSGQTPAS
ncbi:hypothetical protein [Acinetobacter sp.]|uniref:hypothetical protein n=1 Tax=Acinetobacter sp. TaxID=472 RepID=UPI0031D7756B